MAHQIQEVLNEDRAKNLKEISGWLNMSPQRINQIMNLLLLASKIQKDIICSGNKDISLMPEYKVRGIINEVEWEKQIGLWKTLQPF